MASSSERTQVWLRPPAVDKLDRARALLQLEHGGDVLSRPEAIEAALDSLLAGLQPAGQTP